MSNRIKNNLKNLVGQTLNQYYSKVKPTISDLRYKQEYQNRIIECMVGEVDDNYITTPETDNPIVKLEHSKEGLVKVPTVKGNTILVDADGNETDTPAEGCKLVSVGESEDNKLIILSKNKNFMVDWVDGSIISSNGSFGMASNSIRTEYIDIKREVIYIKGLYGNCSSFVAFYDKDKNFLKRTGGNQRTELILKAPSNPNMGNSEDIPLNCKYIAITQYVLATQDTTIDEVKKNVKNVMMSYDDVEYIEPKYHKTEILLNEPLIKLPNGVCDEIVGNKVIRNTKKVVLNGSENWGKRAGSENIISYCFECRLSTMGISQYSTPCISNNLPTNVSAWKDVEHIWLNEWGSATVHISAEKIGEYDVDKFKEWLSNNPIELIYQIEPIIEELPNGMTLQGYDDTTMYIENSITPMVTYGYNALIPYKQELSQQKEEVETNTLDIENNIIPYLMDMEFNLMTMEDK